MVTCIYRQSRYCRHYFSDQPYDHYYDLHRTGYLFIRLDQCIRLY